MIAAVLATVIARELLHVAWEAFANRHRPAVYPRTYRDACGPACRMKLMAGKGWRVRTEAAVQRLAERIRRRVTCVATPDAVENQR